MAARALLLAWLAVVPACASQPPAATRAPSRVVTAKVSDGVHDVAPSAPALAETSSSSPAAEPGHDIAADYLLRLRPRPRHVLVISDVDGTCTELAAAGVDVSCISKDDYPGEESSPPWPNVRFDAVVGENSTVSPGEPPPRVPHAKTVEVVTVNRGLPSATAAGSSDAHIVTIGEQQSDGRWDVLSISSKRPLQTSADGTGAWPYEEDLVPEMHQDGTEKMVRAFGYLVASATGPRIELRHPWAQASVVYPTGPVADRELRPRARQGTLVHNGSDVRAPAGSMLHLYGTGWESTGKAAIVASDTLVAVRGKARFLGRGPLLDDRSRSGPAWSLEVTAVEKIYDRAWWGPYESRHVAHLAKAEEALRSGQWLPAADELDASLRELKDLFGADAPRFDWFDATRRLVTVIREQPFPLGKRCDGTSMLWRGSHPSWRPFPHPADLSLWAVFRRVYADRVWAEFRIEDVLPHLNVTAADQSIVCWWFMTRLDPGFPTARHREVVKKVPALGYD